MKRKILPMLALFASLALTSCGGSTRSQSVSSSSSSEASVSSVAPASTTEPAPASTTEPAPASTSEEASISSEEAPVSSEEPQESTSEEIPVSSEEAPVSSEEAPVSSEAEPSSEAEAISSEVEPISSEVEPASSEVEPSSSAPSSSSSSKHTHTFDETVWEYNANNHWHPATCEHTSQKGSNAKHTFEEQVDDPRAKAATCEETGVKVEICTVCGYEKVSDVAKLAHTYPNDGEYELISEATCEAEGVEKRVCEVCGYEDFKYTPALGHVFVDNGEATGKVHPEIDNGCNTHAYRFDIADAEGWNTPDVKWNVKSGATAQASWAIEEGQLPAGKYKVYLEATMSYDSHGSRYMFNENKEVNPLNPVTGEEYPDQSSSDPDTASQSAWRYYFAINNGDDIYPDCSTTLAEIGYHGGSGAEKVFGLVLSEITIPEGITSFEARHGNIGYSLIVSRIRLVEIKEAA